MFKSFRTNFANAHNSYMADMRRRHGPQHACVSRHDFVFYFSTAFEETMRRATIVNAFAATGIVPADPARPLARLLQLRAHTPGDGAIDAPLEDDDDPVAAAPADSDAGECPLGGVADLPPSEPDSVPAAHATSPASGSDPLPATPATPATPRPILERTATAHDVQRALDFLSPVPASIERPSAQRAPNVPRPPEREIALTAEEVERNRKAELAKLEEKKRQQELDVLLKQREEEWVSERAALLVKAAAKDVCAENELKRRDEQLRELQEQLHKTQDQLQKAQEQLVQAHARIEALTQQAGDTSAREQQAPSANQRRPRKRLAGTKASAMAKRQCAVANSPVRVRVTTSRGRVARVLVPDA